MISGRKINKKKKKKATPKNNDYLINGTNENSIHEI